MHEYRNEWQYFIVSSFHSSSSTTSLILRQHTNTGGHKSISKQYSANNQPCFHQHGTNQHCKDLCCSLLSLCPGISHSTIWLFLAKWPSCPTTKINVHPWHMDFNVQFNQQMKPKVLNWCSKVTDFYTLDTGKAPWGFWIPCTSFKNTECAFTKGLLRLW